MSNDQARIDELEIRVAHQDKTIADLNDVITAQWKKLDDLDRRLRRLSEEVEEAMTSSEAPPVTKPPHY